MRLSFLIGLHHGHKYRLKHFNDRCLAAHQKLPEEGSSLLIGSYHTSLETLT
ncbi:MAG TPA: hypothetical protein VJ869_14975 [Sphaerochaeta sp.]|nr:hypothetical protein [Sphaerochaeta sp.]